MQSVRQPCRVWCSPPSKQLARMVAASGGFEKPQDVKERSDQEAVHAHCRSAYLRDGNDAEFQS
jgi:hypothetical protein